ncbi:MAG: hypothetical protein B6244_07600 [Candidatus Cloacimonetes bacterium 4572_55]|nr:MAG: hypothetical protein B6244_07600 [Candidatus Cloacimonetes bacterium 4572_55]
MVNEKEAKILRGYAKRLDPNDSGAFNNLGVVFFNKKFFDDAIEAFEQALDVDPQNTLARRNLRIALQKSGRYEKFVTDTIDRISRQPDDWRILEGLALFYKKTEDYEKSIHAFEQVLKKRPGNNQIHFHLAEIYTALGQYSDSIRESLISLQHFPESAQLHLFLGQAYYNSGMDDTAIEELKKAIDLEPTSAQAHFLLGFVYGDKGWYEKAVAESQKAIELNPGYARINSNLAIIQATDDEVIAIDEQPSEATTFNRHYSLGVAYFNRNLLKEARDEFVQALEADKDARLIYKNIGEIDLLSGNRREALTNYLKASIVEPYSAKISNDVGVIYHLDGDYIQAFKHYQKALEVDKLYATAKNNLAVLLFQLGMEEESLSFFSLVVHRKDVNLFECCYNYGVALNKLADYDNAIQQLLKAKNLQENSLFVNRNLGITYHDNNQNDKALEIFQKAIQIDPEDAQSYFYKAIVLNSLKRYQEAIDATQKGSELGTFNPQYFFLLATDSFTKRENNMKAVCKATVENEDDLAEIKKQISTNILVNIWEKKSDKSVITEEITDSNLKAPNLTIKDSDGSFEKAISNKTPSLEELEDLYCQGNAEPFLLSMLGGLYMRRKRFDEAIAVLEKSRADNPEAQRMLGILLVKNRSYMDALQAFYNSANHLSEDKQDYRVHVAIGILHEEFGFYTRALRAYKKATSLNENCTVALRKLGYLLLREERLEEAKSTFKSLLKSVPNDLEAYGNLAEIFVKSGRYEQAYRVYQILQKKSPQHTNYQYQLGLCSYGRIFQKAIHGWEKILVDSKDNKKRKKARQQLQYAKEQEKKIRLSFK